jgi:hypothetical protein
MTVIQVYVDYANKYMDDISNPKIVNGLVPMFDCKLLPLSLQYQVIKGHYPQAAATAYFIAHYHEFEVSKVEFDPMKIVTQKSDIFAHKTLVEAFKLLHQTDAAIVAAVEHLQQDINSTFYDKYMNIASVLLAYAVSLKGE